MASKTGRSKLMQHARQAAEGVDRVLVHLKAIDEIAQGANPTVNAHLTELATVLLLCQTAIRKFRAAL